MQTAFREVADALAGRATFGEQLQAQAAQTAAESQRLKLVELRHANGASNSLELLDAQRAAFAAEQQRVLEQTHSGGVCLNDTMLHVAQDDMPFGGVGPSGMGHYHGSEGFKTFSKQKAVFHQSRLNGMSLFNPPYGALFERLAKFLMR